MAVQSGTITSSTNLLDTINTFLAANGWTLNSVSTDGTGKRLHMNRNGCFVHFRSFINESFAAATRANDLAMYTSTGYNGASGWRSQPGRPSPSGNERVAMVDSLTSGSCQYYLYAYNSTSPAYDVVYLAVEGTAGVWSHMLFGNLQKLGSWSGGIFFTGMHDEQINSGVGQANDDLIGVSQSGWNTPPGFVNVTAVNGFTGWIAATGEGSVPRVIGEGHFIRSLFNNNPQSWNSRPTLWPELVYMSWQGATWGATTTFAPIGKLPNVFWVNIKQITPGTLIQLGSDNYRCFPMWKKDAAGSYGASFDTDTYFHGFAIKEF